MKRNPLRSEHPGRRLIVWLSPAVMAVMAIALPHAATPGDITPPPVPANLQVTDGSEPYLIGHASGTQNYVCVPSDSGFAWTLFGPQATLFDDNVEQIMTHFLSPNPVEGGMLRATWQHSQDSSAVYAAAAASSTDPNYVTSGSIAWLLLSVKGTAEGPTGGDTFAGTTFIQRVNTSGGVAPAAGCKSYRDVGKKVMVPYTTDYIFYK